MIQHTQVSVRIRLDELIEMFMEKYGPGENMTKENLVEIRILNEKGESDPLEPEDQIQFEFQAVEGEEDAEPARRRKKSRRNG